MMSAPVETVPSDMALEQARFHMYQQNVHHLVVVDGRRVAGVLSARDLLVPDGADRVVADRMAADPVTGEPDMTLREAANLLRGRGVGCLPVVDGRGRLLGIVTVTDLLELVGRGVEHPEEANKRWTQRRRTKTRREMGKLPQRR